MKITLPTLDLSRYTESEQAEKVIEEISEFYLEQVGEVNLDRLADEGFDVIQAMIGYMRMLGCDVEAANERHLAKMKERWTL